MNDVELRVQLARLDERLIGVNERLARRDEAHERALNLAVSQVEERRKADWTETQRRFDGLNGEAGRLKEMNSQMVSSDVYATDKKSSDARFYEQKQRTDDELEEIRTMIGNLQGKLWLPLAACAAIAAGLAAAAMKLLVH
jgi:hypothetical protein